MEILLAVLLTAGILVSVGVLILRRPGAGAREAVDELARRMTEQLGRLAADSAERIERIRGEMRTDMLDRMNDGFQRVQENLGQHLAAGRAEQDRKLAETVARLENRFDALAQTQSRNLTDSRGELTQALTAMGRAVTEKLSAAEQELRQVGALGESINDLNRLLKLPHLRGKFGEASLERLLADRLPANLYDLQTSTEGGTGRPDAILRFQDRTLPIDSKFPREQVLPLFEDCAPTALEQARKTLAQVMRKEARRVAAYIQPENGTASIALMYLPSETIWFEVVQNRELAAEFDRLRVVPVSPNTLMLALETVALSHKWYQLAAGCERTRKDLVRAQRCFEDFTHRFSEIGTQLNKAQAVFTGAHTLLHKYQLQVHALTAGEEQGELFSADAPPEAVRRVQSPAAV